jgi:hypothetical protein
MTQPLKLKTSNWQIAVFILAPILFFAALWAIFGKEAFRTVFWIVMFLASLLHLLFLLRTKNPVYWIPVLFYVFTALAFVATYPPFRLLCGIWGAILFVVLMYVLITNRIKWRYSEILELAARPVDQSDDGFTPRPFPAGPASYTQDEVTGFARFVLKHVIAFPYFEENRVVFVVPERMYRDFFSLRSDYSNDTYVSFALDGNVSVNIAKKDYQKYKEELTFDQLCQSLGNVFKEFLELYRRGEANRIIDRLNALGIVS